MLKDYFIIFRDCDMHIFVVITFFRIVNVYPKYVSIISFLDLNELCVFFIFYLDCHYTLKIFNHYRTQVKFYLLTLLEFLLIDEERLDDIHTDILKVGLLHFAVEVRGQDIYVDIAVDEKIEEV